MPKPTQYEIDTAREVIEYVLASTQEHEPHAVNTIAELEAVLSAFPYSEDEIDELS